MSYVPATAYVDTTGDSMSGPLAIDTPVGGTSSVRWRVDNKQRWAWYRDTTVAESGSNTGSDIRLSRYDDSGALLGDAIAVSRASGMVTLAGMLGLNSQLRMLNAAGANRWQLYVLNPETGSNQGSDLILGTIADNGSYLANAIVGYRNGTIEIPKLAASATGVITPAGVWGDVGGAYVGLYVTKVGPTVTIEGTMKPSSSVAFSAGIPLTLGTIPVGLRPSHNMFGFAAINTGAAMVAGGLHVDWSGNLQAYCNSAATVSTAGSIGFSLTYKQGN